MFAGNPTDSWVGDTRLLRLSSIKFTKRVYMQAFDYDFFVIGAGSGGVRAARTAAALGVKTGIAEARFFGGTCVNVGCIPKKLYTYAAHARHDFEDSVGYGWRAAGVPEFDWALLKNNKDTEIGRLNGIYQNLLTNAGVDIHQCRATIVGPNSVRLGSQEVTARHILIAAGGRPSVPEFPGSEHALNSDDFFELTQQPRTALVVGGGYIATELAGVFAGLGTHVTLAHRGDMLLRGFDQDIQKFFTDAINSYVDLELNTQVAGIDVVGLGSERSYHVSFADGREIDVDVVLFATGRSPATTDMGLEQCGVALSPSGAVLVDANFQSSVPSIYAVGDVIDRVALTPVALAEGQALARRLFGKNTAASVSYDYIPSAVFSEPQIATVGLTEADARQHYGQIEVFKSQFRPLKHTLSGRQTQTFMKMLVDKHSDRVVGIHMAGADAAEIMQGMAVAMQAGVTKQQFDATIGIHPTAAEEFVTMRTPV
jgi:glutathione reductase (NADPH)